MRPAVDDSREHMAKLAQHEQDLNVLQLARINGYWHKNSTRRRGLTLRAAIESVIIINIFV